MRREDVNLRRSSATCAACHRSRARGSYNDAGDVFICAACQADAKQLIEIQDSIRIQAGEADDATTATEHPDAS